MFVPGHRARMIEKALGLNVDAIMLDIEDGVAVAEKETARQQIAAALVQVQQRLAGSATSYQTPARYVRINSVGDVGESGQERMQADLSAVIRAGLEGLVLPKIETPEQVRTVAKILDRREPEAGISAGSVRLLIAIESPQGLLNAHAIAVSSPRVMGLIFGAEDYGKELGLPLLREGEARDLLYARSALVTAAAAAHVQAVDGVWPNLKDMEGLNTFALQARRLGFTGMSLIHPSQIAPINATFTPTAAEVDYCRQVVQAFDEATARGDGSIAFGGQLIDLPIVERARRTLALAESLRV
ncbi:MAG: CoA ester lyase [Acidobacteria bacterium]|nr:CoA ester lyase [Acidobacteriota bacterium]